MPELRRPLVLTGPPAVGKTSSGRSLAEQRDRAAFVDVDDVRQLVVAGAEAPWRGAEGARQQRLGAVNACALARSFGEDGFDVVIADVLTPGTVAVYRANLPRCLVVRLVVDLDEAHRRAATRRAWLTDQEFVDLHRQDTIDPPVADVVLDAAVLGRAEQCAVIGKVWAERSGQVG